MRHVKSFSDFVNEDWQPDRRIKSGAHQGFLTAYVDPDRTPNLKPDSIGFERVLRMLHAMESGKKSQMELAKVHDEGEPTHSGPFQRPDPGHKSTNNTFLLSHSWSTRDMQRLKRKALKFSTR